MEVYEYKIKKQEEMEALLYDLIENWEDEVVEFKEANNDFDKDSIGKYFSAISNEANLRNLQHGWLVFGVENRTRRIVNTDYRDERGLQSLKNEIAQNTSGGMTFIDIYEVYPKVRGKEKRVVMFQIPAAISAIPTTWKGYDYGRDGESVKPLSQEKRERIRRQTYIDWSKRYVKDAEMLHLNKEAIMLAREKFKERMDDIHISDEVDNMTDEEFLEARKLVVNGNITNAAMLLLGDERYDYLMEMMPEASWRVYDSKDMVKDYKIFKIPYITLPDRITENIRNLTYRYMPDQMTLFPQEIKQFDSWVLRELLNNCIVHSDYSIGGRIYVNEFEDRLVLTNPGSFIPKSIEKILRPSYTSPFYRNQLLADAMVSFKMIDTETTGIRRAFNIQRERFFPLPDYALYSDKVEVTLYGREIDEKFTYLLHNNDELDLTTVYLLDQVQKGRKIPKEAIAHLRRYRLVEGRVNSLYIAAPLAQSDDEKASYIKNKGFDNQYYQDLIIDYIGKFGKASRQQIRVLLLDKLPDTMTEEQKERKITYLLTMLKNENEIERDGSSKQHSCWVIKNKDVD